MFYKYIDDKFIIGVGIGTDGEEITEQEYNALLDKINNRPTASEGFTYRLTTALQWELCKLPPTVENNEDSEEV